MKRALMKIAHDLLRLVVWFLLSGLASAGLLAVWRSQYATPTEESAAVFVACLIVGCALAVAWFFLSKRVASALVPINRTTRSLT